MKLLWKNSLTVAPAVKWIHAAQMNDLSMTSNGSTEAPFFFNVLFFLLRVVQ